MKIIKNLTFAALAATLLFQTSITRADDHGPQQITFQKCWDEATQSFVGTVAGDCGVGDVIAKILSVDHGTKVLHFTGEYTVITPDCSFKTVGDGIWILAGDQVVWNGVVTEVTDGQDLLGAQVQVRAQVTNGGTCSHGTMTITPSGRD